MSVLFFSLGQISAQEIKRVDIESKELAHHVLDSLEHYSIGVCLPPSYKKTERNYPVLYFLPGYGCGYFDKGRFVTDYHQGIEDGTFKEMIVVFIDGCTPGSLGNFYLNSDALGDWEDFMLERVIPLVDEKYRTISSKHSRAIAGHSMGGYGALLFAMKNSDMFGTLYSHSPGLFSFTGLEDCQMFNDTANVLAYLKFEEKLKNLSRGEAHKSYMENLPDMDFNLRFTIEYGMAVAPNVEKNAPYTDFPFSFEGDQLVKNDSLWIVWKSGFGLLEGKIMKYESNLKSLNSLVIDFGTDDYYPWIPEGCRYFSDLLQSHGISHSLLEYPGGHSNMSRYTEKMFPILMESFVFEE
jgi:enterochelin esterase-like enzyme